MFDRWDKALVEALHKAALALRTRADLDPLIAAMGDARYILLGEASHGTHDYYVWRTEITKRLILEERCSFIAVEGDWPDCYKLNRYIKAYPDSGESAEEVLRVFDRWPTWMWANREVVELAEWLRDHNAGLPPQKRVGFYGLDVYSLWDSMAAVVQYLETVDPKSADAARRAYHCFQPYGGDPQAYARATVMVPASCEDAAVSVLKDLRSKAPVYQEDGREAYYNAEQNALIAQGAERYYRAMVRGGAASWNVRDRHMEETLERLMVYHGQDARAIVWEHNTHVGDARYTDMASAGMVNVGQLVREHHPAPGATFLVGFASWRGEVVAAEHWGARMEVLSMPAGRKGSAEDLLHRVVESMPPDADGRWNNLMLIFDGSGDGGIPGLEDTIDHRAVGVVYDPHAERWGNYVPTVLPLRYDALLFFNETRALSPLHLRVGPDLDAPETFPSGM